MSTVLWGRLIEGVGLNVTLTLMGIPVLIPPVMPPIRLVSVTILPSFNVRASLLSEPLIEENPVPRPNSTAFTAGIAKRAFARSPSRVSKTGSPIPGGMLSVKHSTTPPRLSPCSEFSAMSSTILSAVSGSPHRTGLPSAFSLISSGLTSPARSPPISLAWASTSTSRAVVSSFLAMAPAIT